MTRRFFKLLLTSWAICLVDATPASAELQELPIRCWAQTEVEASVVGFVNQTLVVEDTYGNVLYGFNTEDCSEKWTVDRSQRRLTDTRIANGTVFVQFLEDPENTDDPHAVFKSPGVLLAVASDTGAIVWESESLAGYALGFAATSEVVVLDGAGRLEVFRASDGELLWSKEPTFAGWLSGSPTISVTTIVRNDSSGSEQEDGAFTAFDVATGDVLWEQPVPRGSLSVNVGTGPNATTLIFLTFKTIGGSEARVISVFDPATGASRLDKADELAIDALSDGNLLFYLTADAPDDLAQLRLKSVDLQTGTTRFVVDVEHLGWLVGVTSDSVIVVDDREPGSRTTTIRAFDSSDGSQQWFRELEGTGDFRTPAHAISDSSLFVAHDDRLAVVDLGNGSVHFEALLPALESEFARSETGWCPEGDFYESSLVESEGVVALETCTSSVAIIDVP